MTALRKQPRQPETDELPRSEPENDRALAIMLAVAFLFGLAMIVALILGLWYVLT